MQGDQVAGIDALVVAFENYGIIPEMTSKDRCIIANCRIQHP